MSAPTRPVMSKVVDRAVTPRTRVREFADGSRQTTWDAVAAYELACGHTERRAVRHVEAASSVGSRLKCRACSKASS